MHHDPATFPIARSGERQGGRGFQRLPTETLRKNTNDLR